MVSYAGLTMTTEQIYTAIDELITQLNVDGNQKLAVILEHRMYKVSWTSSTEMLENIASILEGHVVEHENIVDKILVKKEREILKAIKTTISPTN